MGAGDEIEARVEKWVHGGKSIARTSDARICFLPRVLPGETVSAVVTRAHRDYLEGSVRSLIQSVPDRRSAPCPYYAGCGGCHLQHASEPLQAKLKADALADTLRRVGRLDLGRAERFPILLSPEPFSYRNRIHLRSRRGPEGLVFGLYAEGSHELVPIDRCLLVPDAMNRVLATLGETMGENIPAEETPTIELQVSVPDERVIAVLGSRRLLHAPVLERLFAQLHARCPHIVGLISRTRVARRVIGRSALEYRAGDLTYSVSDRSFVQPNWGLTVSLIERIVDWLGPPGAGNQTILELFSGAGTFTLPLARRGFFVTGVEHNPVAVADAQANMARNRLSRCRFIRWDMDSGLPSRILSAKPPDVVLLDPPRSGLPVAALEGIIRLRPGRILYLSCDPPTLARDLGRLARRGYEPTRILPVDFFPQTYHIETLVELVRREKTKR